MIGTEAERQTYRRRDAAVAVSCPICGVPAGTPCTDPPAGWAAHKIRVHVAARER